jgi:hypothetical protein
MTNLSRHCEARSDVAIHLAALRLGGQIPIQDDTACEALIQRTKLGSDPQAFGRCKAIWSDAETLLKRWATKRFFIYSETRIKYLHDKSSTQGNALAWRQP